MYKSLLNEKIAVLVANGFCEQDLTQIQRALMKEGANIRIVSMDHGLVNSWNGTGWGLNFAADQALNSALAADYSILIIPGGQRSAEKLKLTAHTKRFLRGFLETSKPVVLCNEAVELLAFAELMAGRKVAGPEAMKDACVAAGGEWAGDSTAVDGMLMTGRADEQTREAFAKEAVAFLVSGYELRQAA